MGEIARSTWSLPLPHAPMMADMLGNQIAAGVGSVRDFIENHKGKVHVVAVLSTAARPPCPILPTFDELGLRALKTCRTTASTP